MSLAVVAYVNYGRWVAKCLRCTNAEHAGPDPVSGHTGGLTGGGFHCRVCDLRCGVVWPPNVDDIWRLLCARPDPANRNWEPPETIHDLLRDNLTHGVLPPLDALNPAAASLQLVGDHIMVGRGLLPALPLPAIGGR